LTLLVSQVLLMPNFNHKPSCTLDIEKVKNNRNKYYTWHFFNGELMFENFSIANDFLPHSVFWLTFFLLVSWHEFMPPIFSLEKFVTRFSHEFVTRFSHEFLCPILVFNEGMTD
jgi:hypothetical protein